MRSFREGSAALHSVSKTGQKQLITSDLPLLLEIIAFYIGIYVKLCSADYFIKPFPFSLNWKNNNGNLLRKNTALISCIEIPVKFVSRRNIDHKTLYFLYKVTVSQIENFVPQTGAHHLYTPFYFFLFKQFANL